jgi:CheY-like chemotaxis protein
MKNLKIMITGRNRRIVNDICKHLTNDKGIVPVKCGASKKAVLEMTLDEYPNVVIICAGDETADTVKVFDILREAARSGAVEIIVVANEADRKMYTTYSALDRFFFLARPVSLMALYKKLDDLGLKFEALSNALELEEFVNDRNRDEKKHILVVDDDPEQLVLIKEQLEEFYRVTVINGGKNIFRVLEKNRIDLILLDYLMPEIDGPHVLDMIRARSEYEDIPVIFLTGMADRDAVIQLFTDHLPQGYVLKPSKKSELVAKIIDVLG